MIFLAALAFVAVVGIFGIVYLSHAIGRFGFIKRIAGENERASWLIRLAIVLLCFGFFALLLSVLDAALIVVHLLFFWLVFDLIFWLIRKKTGKELRINWPGWLALLVTTVYLTVGYIQCVHVWKTEYSLQTNKDVGELRIAVISDSHLGNVADGEGFASHLDVIMQQEPDLILIAGDLVDDASTREDMLLACEALGRLDPQYGIWYVYGNHDKGYYDRRGFSATELARALESNGVHVLEDEVAYVGDLCIVGRSDASSSSRKDISQLLRGVDTSKYLIVLDHQPADYEAEAASSADLVISGHTHGGQLIPIGLIGELAGLNDFTYGHTQLNGTDFIVTSGLSNWAIHFKTGTRSEYVIITLTGSGDQAPHEQTGRM
ncbi:MAG: metallophosphoesterase [Coriobacteriales bacterium]|nr:metallophosphoesterase [Coriobacteriales bacterium]